MYINKTGAGSMQKRLIVIEGLDGSGKSTQVALLKEYLTANGTPVRQIKLPDYDDRSEEHTSELQSR